MSLYPPDLEDTDPADLTYPAEPGPGRFRVLFAAAVGPLFMGYTAVAAVLALVLAVATRADISPGGVLSAAMPGWLAAYQVPLTIGGHGFGALPLLPTVLIVLLAGRSAGNAADRLMVGSARDTVPVIATIAIAHAVMGVVFAEVTSMAAFFAGLLVPAGVSAAAAVLGLARRGYFEDLLDRFDSLVVHGLRAGLIGLATLTAVGAVLFALGLTTSFPTVQAMFDREFGDALGLLLLSVAYVPNAVVAGMSFAAGPGVTLGQVTATPLNFDGGPLPAVPVLAALPEKGAVWWPVVFVFTIGVGALVGWVLRHASDDPIVRLRAVGGAAVVVAAGCAVFALGAGGQLAGGVFNPLSMHPWSLGVAALLWIALPAATVTWWAGPRLELTPSRSLLADAVEAEAQAEEEPSAEEVPEPEPAAEPEPEAEPADEPDEESRDELSEVSEEEPEEEPEQDRDLPGEIDK